MNKFNFIFCVLAATLISSCVSKQVGLKENWIDERDVIALTSNYVSEWMVKAGRPTLVEINGDTSIYYYNYRPTMYATTIYDSTTFFATWGTAKETKPSLENSTEVWGSRKDIMQIKVVNNIAVSAIITNGPDKKSFIRDLNGNFILDPLSGYNSNISDEQKIGKSSEHFKNAYSKLYSKDNNAVAGTNMNPWEYYRYKQQIETNGPSAADSAALFAEPAQPVAEPVQQTAEQAQSVAEQIEHIAAEPAAAAPAEPPVATPASHPQAIGH
ncbi:hypothetical protein R83H12_03153 [Fibrobacteria bacterium R8-3-H12]